MAYLLPVIFIGVIFSIVYTIVRFRKLWSITKLPKSLYFLVQAIMIVNYFVMATKADTIPYEWLADIMMIIGAVYFMFFLYGGMCCVILDIVAFFIRKRNPENGFARIMKDPRRGLRVIFILTVMFGVLGVMNMRTMQLTDYQVTINKSSSINTLKAVMISDAHIGTAVTRAGITEMVDKMMAQKPEIIFIVGDIFDHSTSESLRKETTKQFTRLKAKYGVYYVEGNHEVYLKSDYVSYFKQAGIRVLQDQSVDVNGLFTVVGRRDFSGSPKPVEELLVQVNKSHPVIMLEHQPRKFTELSKAGVDLVLCGHTHGGQFPLGNIGTSIVNDMNYGEKNIGNMQAITSSGIGGWGVPTKSFYKSEIVVLTLKFK